jgi:hypothetical protein
MEREIRAIEINKAITPTTADFIQQAIEQSSLEKKESNWVGKNYPPFKANQEYLQNFYTGMPIG